MILRYITFRQIFGCILLVLLSACQTLDEVNSSLISGVSDIIIPTNEDLPDLNTATPINNAVSTADDNMPTHVPAKVPETTLSALDTVAIAPPPTAPEPRFYPANSMGWGREELITTLGNADYIRRDGAGEVHQYRLASCIIDFTLYPRQSRIEIIAWHGRSRIQNQNIDAEACYRDLARRKAGK
jgi:hypothetical protein